MTLKEAIVVKVRAPLSSDCSASDPTLATSMRATVYYDRSDSSKYTAMKLQWRACIGSRDSAESLIGRQSHPSAETGHHSCLCSNAVEW